MIGRRDFLKTGFIVGASAIAVPGLAASREEVLNLHLLVDARLQGAVEWLRNSKVVAADASSTLRVFQGGTDLAMAQSLIRDAGSLPLVGVTTFSDRLIFEGLVRQMNRPFHLVSDERSASGQLAADHWARLERDMLRSRKETRLPVEWNAIVMKLAQTRGASIWLSGAVRPNAPD
ncbi:MAG: hypothetical protein BGO57_13910 [Sphingomonadales bacterium 63-6]|nr:MAG: hypothetical protein BGO57_13910 [Sphingomonadales bacterium 63-6]